MVVMHRRKRCQSSCVQRQRRLNSCLRLAQLRQTLLAVIAKLAELLLQNSKLSCYHLHQTQRRSWRESFENHQAQQSDFKSVSCLLKSLARAFGSNGLQTLFAAVKQQCTLGASLQRALSKDVAVQVQLSPQEGTPSSGTADATAATLAAAAATLAASVIEPGSLQQRVHSYVSFLDKDVLDVVFSYVGLGDFLYTGAVCRRWRGRYIKLCYENAAEGQTEKLRTSYRSPLITAARLQLALDSGLKMTELQQHKRKFALAVATHLLDPISVLSLAKLYDMAWPS
jgi:septum formation topological specificity factor MinE